jgi:uncharacterized protein YecT (DUF1311 family)
MKRLVSFAAVGVGLLISASGFGASSASDSCDAATATEVNRCVQQQFADQDRALNEAYQKILLQLNTDWQQSTRDGLIKAQRLWIQFRNADCKAQESVYDGGTVHTWVYLRCLRDHTAQRVKDLDPLNWQGG